MGTKLAIDFGTTNSVAARWHESKQTAEVLLLDNFSQQANPRPELIPSLVYLQDGAAGKSILGQAAQQAFYRHGQPERLFRNFKRGIISGQGPARILDGHPWTARDAGRVFLRGLLAALPCEPRQIEHLVVSAPVASFGSYLTWLQDTLSALEADRVRVVDESTAAALGYAVTEPGAVVLVVDFGGGTLDLSLVQLPESRAAAGGPLSLLRRGGGKHSARVIAKAGAILGGSDVDTWLLDHALDQLGIEAEATGPHRDRAVSDCEAAKIALSTQESVTLALHIDGAAHTLSVTRPDLEDLLAARGFFDSLDSVLKRLMHAARRQGVFREDMQHVLLVGGMSLMPCVQEKLARYFAGAVLHTDRPFTAVVEGALQVAIGMGLDDVLPHSYGLRCWNAEDNMQTWDEIFQQGNCCPSTESVEVLLGPTHPGQKAIELVIGVLDASAISQISVREVDGQTVFVGHADTQHAIPLNCEEAQRIHVPLSSDKTRIKATFSVDASRQLRVTARNAKNGRVLLDDVVIATLAEASPASTSQCAATGLEPAVLSDPAGRGLRRLSLRRLGGMLNMLPPEAITLEAAAAMLHSREFYVRYSAAQMLARRGDRPARMVLKEALETGNAPTRASTARHLFSFSWTAAKPLIKQALADPDPRVQEGAVYALCDRGEPAAYALTARVLQDAPDALRAAAAWGLRNTPDALAVPVLAACLLAQDAEIRTSALEALGTNGSPEALPIVRRAMLDDTAFEVRYAATLSLLELSQSAALSELCTLIQNTGGTIRQAILQGLFHATNYLHLNLEGSAEQDALIAALETALKDPLPEARMAAIWPLAWMTAPGAVTALETAYNRESDPEVRAHMARVAASLSSPALLPA